MHLDALRRLAAKAITNGGRFVSPYSIEWDISSNCLAPVTREFFARKDRERNLRENDWSPGDETPLTVTLHVRCRLCEQCSKRRGRVWAQKAHFEIVHSMRTWLVTLTIDPQHHFEAMLRARQKLSRSGVDWDKLTPKQQFAERHRQFSPELTLWLKRIREESEAPLRYLLVAEVHTGKKSKDGVPGINFGMPHYHCLVHEPTLKQVHERTLRHQWLLGNAEAKLVRDHWKGAWYCAKYLGKDAAARVRASIRYGLQSSSDTGQQPQRGDRGDVPPDGSSDRFRVAREKKHDTPPQPYPWMVRTEDTI